MYTIEKHSLKIITTLFYQEVVVGSFMFIILNALTETLTLASNICGGL